MNVSLRASDVHSAERLGWRCRRELKQAGPVLVVAPSSHVDNWASNWEFWAEPGTNVVSYMGMSAARTLIHDHELWLSPESLDSKSSFWLKQGLPSRVSPTRDCNEQACMDLISSAVLDMA